LGDLFEEMTIDSSRTVLVVPCYNEADRLRPEDIDTLIDARGVEVVLVDDGSTDSTADLLKQIADSSERVSVESLPANVGKAEAVRQGLLVAIDRPCEWVGYCDADMATPAAEILRLAEIASARADLSVVLASRVSLLGLNVERSAMRHYRGRVFATAASSILRVPVYDTQCGAKLFRNTDALRDALSQPFHSRWSFDVELLGRLLRGRGSVAPVPIEEFIEVPLKEWRDISGSKIGAISSIRSGLELGLIAKHLRRW
jgi:dolichyl-phosphate beta-glucosyltransferase